RRVVAVRRGGARRDARQLPLSSASAAALAGVAADAGAGVGVRPRHAPAAGGAQGRRRAARPPGGRRRRRAMPDRVKDRVADMMRWHRRTVIAVAALLVFALGRFFAPPLPELRVVVGLGLLTALLATVCPGLITVRHVFL